ncbi:MAG: DUF4132 domain-containing protein [Dehalococcoidia bacterium]
MADALTWSHFAVTCSHFQEISGAFVGHLARAAERYLADHEMSLPLRHDLERAHKSAHGRQFAFPAAERKGVAALNELLAQPSAPRVVIDFVDDWGQEALAARRAMSDDDGDAWDGALEFAATATASKPPAKWLKAARDRIAAVGPERFAHHATAWLSLLDRPTGGGHYRTDNPQLALAPTALITERNATLLRGIAWMASLTADDAVARALGVAALQCFKKLPDIGPRSARAGNACVWALGAMPRLEASAQLQRLATRVPYSEAKRLIEESLRRAAERAGLSRDDLDDLAVPAFDLEDGRVRHRIGDFSAELALNGNRVETRWYGADGQPRAAEPSSLKRSHAAELKALKQTASDLGAALTAQRDRIERGYLGERSWTYAGWRERWLGHPLLSHFAVRLIWSFEQEGSAQLGMWREGRLVDAHDKPLPPPADDVLVRLWHPIQSSPEEVLAWRLFLERHEVTQPFKQAHREVYILTDAERATATYSNRFAQHVVRQHQFAALCRARGWSFRLHGAFDGGEMPARAFPRHDLRVEFHVEPLEADADADATGRGVFLLLATDRLCFLRGATPPHAARGTWLRTYMATGDPFAGLNTAYEPIPLSDVPPVVFSEAMRDVDLFIGVCSIGADPTWAVDRRDADRAMWHSLAFGDLSVSASTRRDLLERLLPKLAIAPRCRLTRRFLVVRGDLRTYKIHLGSGNILMEPNDQYLCIVPGREEEGHVRLPFEGDRTLALILSKAFLLAADTAITDPTITRQIGV